MKDFQYRANKKCIFRSGPSGNCLHNCKAHEIMDLGWSKMTKLLKLYCIYYIFKLNICMFKIELTTLDVGSAKNIKQVNFFKNIKSMFNRLQDHE